MTLAVELHPDASDELENAAAWYEARRPGLGYELIAEVEGILRRIADNPHEFPVWMSGDAVRRAACGRFPYALFFDVQPDRVTVLAVAHGSRRPGYWTNRRP